MRQTSHDYRRTSCLVSRKPRSPSRTSVRADWSRRLSSGRRIDVAALKLAMKLARGQPGRAGQLDRKLEDEDWFEVAMFAAYCCQCRALQLKPWQPAPMHSRKSYLEEPFGDVFGCREAAELLQRMLALGISRYHPDPLKAIEDATAEQPVSG